jgi:hypothetical protein
MNPPPPSELPETIETLLDWKLSNSDVQFSDEEFLDGFEEHAKEANALFDAAFSEGL